jgi:hypothetical protein
MYWFIVRYKVSFYGLCNFNGGIYGVLSNSLGFCRFDYQVYISLLCGFLIYIKDLKKAKALILYNTYLTGFENLLGFTHYILCRQLYHLKTQNPDSSGNTCGLGFDPQD